MRSRAGIILELTLSRIFRFGADRIPVGSWWNPRDNYVGCISEWQLALRIFSDTNPGCGPSLRELLLGATALTMLIDRPSEKSRYI